MQHTLEPVPSPCSIVYCLCEAPLQLTLSAGLSVVLSVCTPLASYTWQQFILYIIRNE